MRKKLINYLILLFLICIAFVSFLVVKEALSSNETSNYDKKTSEAGDLDSVMDNLSTSVDEFAKVVELTFKKSVIITISKDDDDALYIKEFEDLKDELSPTDKKYRVLLENLKKRLKLIAKHNKERLFSVILRVDKDVEWLKIRTMLKEYEQNVFDITNKSSWNIHYVLAEISD